jgi:hypothetical protein
MPLQVKGEEDGGEATTVSMTVVAADSTPSGQLYFTVETFLVWLTTIGSTRAR